MILNAKNNSSLVGTKYKLKIEEIEFHAHIATFPTEFLFTIDSLHFDESKKVVPSIRYFKKDDSTIFKINTASTAYIPKNDLTKNHSDPFRAFTRPIVIYIHSFAFKPFKYITKLNLSSETLCKHTDPYTKEKYYEVRIPIYILYTNHIVGSINVSLSMEDVSLENIDRNKLFFANLQNLDEQILSQDIIYNDSFHHNKIDCEKFGNTCFDYEKNKKYIKSDSLHQSVDVTEPASPDHAINDIYSSQSSKLKNNLVKYNSSIPPHNSDSLNYITDSISNINQINCDITQTLCLLQKIPYDFVFYDEHLNTYRSKSECINQLLTNKSSNEGIIRKYISYIIKEYISMNSKKNIVKSSKHALTLSKNNIISDSKPSSFFIS